jgi:hypothetical protein
MVRLDDVKELKVDCPRSHLTWAMDGDTVALASAAHLPHPSRGRLTVIAPD